MDNVVEAPAMNSQCLLPGTVAVVSVDPIASVVALEDEQATLEASKLSRGKYLAIVDAHFGMDWNRPMYEMPLGLSFFCVGRGLPEPASASLRLSPDAPVANDRPALTLSPPLPWPDCCVHTIECFYARISRVFLCKPPTNPTILSEEQRRTVNRAVIHDQMTEAVPMRDAYGKPLEIEDAFDSDDEPSRYDIESVGRGESAQSGRSSGNEAVSNGEPEAEAVQAGDPVHTGEPEVSTGRDPYRTWPQLEVWLDLTSTADIGEPAELMRTLRQLTIIEHEAKQRKVLSILADQPRTAQWADDVAAADGSVDLEQPASSDVERAGDDISIMPEDAIEHRVDRAIADTATAAQEPVRAAPASKTDSGSGKAQKRATPIIRVWTSFLSLLRRLKHVAFPVWKRSKRRTP